jgi:tRNA (guanine-N7-)-methyltransferase
MTRRRRVRQNGPMPEPHVTPARPHHRFTEDGRRIREVLSYSRRGSRFTPSQREAWEAHSDAWVIPEPAVDDPGFRRRR